MFQVPSERLPEVASIVGGWVAFVTYAMIRHRKDARRAFFQQHFAAIFVALVASADMIGIGTVHRKWWALVIIGLPIIALLFQKRDKSKTASPTRISATPTLAQAILVVLVVMLLLIPPVISVSSAMSVPIMGTRLVSGLVSTFWNILDTLSVLTVILILLWVWLGSIPQSEMTLQVLKARYVVLHITAISVLLTGFSAYGLIAMAKLPTHSPREILLFFILILPVFLAKIFMQLRREYLERRRNSQILHQLDLSAKTNP